MGVTDDLAALADALRAATGSSRVTVRGPGARGGSTDLLAESLAPGVPSMTTAAVTGIVEAPTYVWLREHRDVLLQSDCSVDPLPPISLTGDLGVRAQMLGPLLRNGELIGTVSVHEQGRTRNWSAADEAALRATVAAVDELLASR